jgi:hypothetical protein
VILSCRRLSPVGQTWTDVDRRGHERGAWARSIRTNYNGAMPPLRAHVHKGRLVLDEPTDLPEGEVVELVPVDEVLAAGGDYLDDDERKRLHAALERSMEDVKAGRTVDARKVVEKLRARAASR